MLLCSIVLTRRQSTIICTYIAEIGVGAASGDFDRQRKIVQVQAVQFAHIAENFTTAFLYRRRQRVHIRCIWDWNLCEHFIRRWNFISSHGLLQFISLFGEALLTESLTLLTKTIRVGFGHLFLFFYARHCPNRYAFTLEIEMFSDKLEM